MSYPNPPDGYQTAVRFQYPIRNLQIAAFIALVASLIGFLYLAHWLNSDVAIMIHSASRIPDIVVIILSLIATVIVHEAVHGLIYRFLGYRVSYGVSLRLGAAYAAAFGQWQKRNHNLMAALAPLFCLTPLLIVLLIPPYHQLNLAAITALIFNSSGSMADLYLAQRLIKMPKEALLYDLNAQTMLIYLPI